MMALADVVEYMIAVRPGRTVRELTMAIFGASYQKAEVERACHVLVRDGRLSCRTEAGRPDESRFFAAVASYRPQQPKAAAGHSPSLLSLFQALRSDLRLSHARLFVEVAVQEGLSIYEYARRLALPESTTRDHCLDLAQSANDTAGRPALLRIQGSPDQIRSSQCKLTVEGCRLLARLWDSMEAA
jgi:hypothetical protein